MADLQWVICTLVHLCTLVCVLNVPGTSCVYRSSSSRYSYSRYSGSTYRSYRSSGYSYYSPSSYRFTTRYNRGYYGSTLRYTRAYYLRPGGYYYYYYNQYYTYRTGNTDNTYGHECSNWEANDNGTALGVFYCPLPFEPSSHKYCCGESYAQYCCKFMDVSAHRWGVALGAIAGVAIIAVAAFVVYRLCVKPKSKQNGKVMSSSTPTTRPTRYRPPSVTPAVRYNNQPSTSAAGGQFYPYATPASQKAPFVPYTPGQQPPPSYAASGANDPPQLPPLNTAYPPPPAYSLPS